MQDDSPLTEKDVKSYFHTVDSTPDERELERDIVHRMLRCLNQRSSILVAPQYHTSISSGWSQDNYAPSYPSNYQYSEEPSTMAEAESQMPPDQNRTYPQRRPIYPPANDGYSSYPYYAAHAGQQTPYIPRGLNTYGNDIQVESLINERVHRSYF